MTRRSLAFGQRITRFDIYQPTTTTMKIPRRTRKPIELIGDSTDYRPLRKFFADVTDDLLNPIRLSVSKSFDLDDQENNIKHTIWVTRSPDNVTFHVHVIQKGYFGTYKGLLFEAYLKATTKRIPLEIIWHHEYDIRDDDSVDSTQSPTLVKILKRTVDDIVYIWTENAIVLNGKAGAK
jgi:hypothetical protein